VCTVKYSEKREPVAVFSADTTSVTVCDAEDGYWVTNGTVIVDISTRLCPCRDVVHEKSSAKEKN